MRVSQTPCSGTINPSPFPPSYEQIPYYRCAALESVPRHEYEQHDDTNSCQDRKEQDHQSPLVHQLADIRLSYPGPIHEGIFAEARKSEDGVDGVLLG